MEWMVVVFLIVAALLSLVGKSRPNQSAGYRTRGALFTKAERSFLGVLNQSIPEDCCLFGKVRVADVLSPQKGLNRKQWQVAFNRIAAKHFDYVLCRKDDLAVVAAIELDDKSHRSKRAAARDAFLEKACDSANLPLIRFPAQASYQIPTVKSRIEQSLRPLGSDGLPLPVGGEG